MNDSISRQAAIDTEGLDEQIRCEMCRNPMHTDRGCDGNCKYDEKLYGRIMQILGERIKQLSSAQPEPKRGRWILHTYLPHHNYCSICEKDSPYNKRWNFCPNCGSYNGGEINDQ